MPRNYYTYILTNKSHTALYVGVTSNLIKRVWQHKEKSFKGFTSLYNINKLVWYEVYDDIEEAIKREKTLKGGSRTSKVELIEKQNPTWKDLYESLFQ